MSGGGTKTQTQTTNEKRDPYAPAVPALQTILDGSLNAYNSGQGGQVYQGPRVAGFGDTSQAGQNFLTNNATAGLGTAQAGDTFLQGLLQGGGATDATQAATRGLLGVDPASTGGIAQAAARLSNPNSMSQRVAGQLAGGKYHLDGSGFADLNSSLAGPTQVQKSLQGAADGAYLDGGNPYLDKIVGQGNADALNAVKGSFSASGRYGSGMFSNAAADAVSRNENDLRYSDYSAERDRQAQAAQAIDSGLLSRTAARENLYTDANNVRSANAGQAVQGAQLGLAGEQAALAGQQALYGANEQNAAQRIGQFGTALQAGQADRASALAGIAATPGVQSSLLAPGTTLAGAGAQQDALRQRQLAAAQDKFNEQQQSPWARLGLLEGTALPIANAGGTSQGESVTKVPQPGLLQQLLGYGLAGANVASKFI